MKFRPYANYKDSGVRWLGDVPSDWELQRIRRIFEIKKRIAGKLGFDVLSVTQDGFRVKDTESNEGQLSQDYSKYQIVLPGDFAMNPMDLLSGGADVAKSIGVTSPDYRVFSLRKPSKYDERFFLYLFRHLYRNKLFFPFGQGSSQLGRWRLPRKEFNDFVFPVPDKTDQTRIADFLDAETAKIDELIAKQERLIELSQEKRQALISHAVVQGLKPDAPMKYSGISWLGEVPVNWRVQRLRYLCSITTGNKNTEDASDDGKYPFFVRSQEIERSNNYSFDGEGILTAGDGAGVAKVFHYFTGKFAIHQRVYLLHAFKGIQGNFLFHYIKANLYKVVLEGNAKSTVDSLRLPMFKDFVVAYPPSDAEQTRIIEHIAEESRKIDLLIEKARRAIEFLKEHRTVLVSAAVTGKIDVLGAE